jgi:hypothetical protein
MKEKEEILKYLEDTINLHPYLNNPLMDSCIY